MSAPARPRRAARGAKGARQPDSSAASRPIARRQERGQAMVEYVVVSLALVVALGIGLKDDDSVLWQLAQAFQLAYRKFSYALSLPT